MLLITTCYDKINRLYKAQKWVPLEKPQPTNVFTLSKVDSDGCGACICLACIFEQVNNTLLRGKIVVFQSFAKF